MARKSKPTTRRAGPKLHADLRIGGKLHKAGDRFPTGFVYPFFAVHMGMFGLSGFFMAYSGAVPLSFLYMHGGIAITVYLAFYLAIFGPDEVKWMFINAALGVFGIYAEIDYLLSWFGKRASDYPVAAHLVPFLYYVLYTFLFRQALLDFTGSREDPARRRRVETAYVAVSIAVYGALWVMR